MCGVVVTDTGTKVSDLNLPTWSVEGQVSRGREEPSALPAVARSHEAHVIFTSGSEGEPKGVCIRHESAVNTCLDINHRFEITKEDCVLACSAYNFDLSVYDIFGVLGAGGSLATCDPDRATDAEHWSERLDDANVTVWNAVPRSLESLVLHNCRPHKLRVVMASGDKFPAALATRILNDNLRHDARLIVLGGATEASIWSNLYEVKREEVIPTPLVPYGKALTNQTLMVLDERALPGPAGGFLRRRRVGAIGRIYIGGVGVAAGYTDPALTEKSSSLTAPAVRCTRRATLGATWTTTARLRSSDAVTSKSRSEVSESKLVRSSRRRNGSTKCASPTTRGAESPSSA
jgi:non-ribosomal peptide synthetase component F